MGWIFIVLPFHFPSQSKWLALLRLASFWKVLYIPKGTFGYRTSWVQYKKEIRNWGKLLLSRNWGKLVVPLVLFPNPNFTLRYMTWGWSCCNVIKTATQASIFVISSLRIIKVSYPSTSNLYIYIYIYSVIFFFFFENDIFSNLTSSTVCYIFKKKTYTFIYLFYIKLFYCILYSNLITKICLYSYTVINW